MLRPGLVGVPALHEPDQACGVNVMLLALVTFWMQLFKPLGSALVAVVVPMKVVDVLGVVGQLGLALL